MRLSIALLMICCFATHVSSQHEFTGRNLYFASQRQLNVTTAYDSKYQRISYPGGDVPMHTGVCTDVIVRAFRVLGVDLQKEIHEDMTNNWDAYPKLWNLSKPDPNIDHRRVPNLMTYFARKGYQTNDSIHRIGDIIVFNLGNNVLHIGIVSNSKILALPGLAHRDTFKIIHNIGEGVNQENILGKYPIVAKYRLR